MSLRKCTVTQLDDTFWRVDYDYWLGVGGHSVRSPQVLKRFGERWFVQGYPHEDANGLDALLTRLGLTRHEPTPETAEQRVRAAVADPEGLQNVALFKGDLRAILDELDRLRAQRPVDVEAVLAPVRSCLAAWEERVNSLAASRDAHMAKLPGVSPNYIEAGIAEVERWSLMVAAKSLRTSITEAEKVAAVKP